MNKIANFLFYLFSIFGRKVENDKLRREKQEREREKEMDTWMKE